MLYQLYILNYFKNQKQHAKNAKLIYVNVSNFLINLSYHFLSDKYIKYNNNNINLKLIIVI